LQGLESALELEVSIFSLGDRRDLTGDFRDAID
jgi:hypothetical protein